MLEELVVGVYLFCRVLRLAPPWRRTMRAWFMLGNKLAVAPLTGTSWFAMQHAPRCVIVWLLEVIDSCCYDFPRRFSDRQGTSPYEMFCIGIAWCRNQFWFENCANFKVRDRIQAVLCQINPKLAKNQAHQNSSTDEIDDFWDRWNLAFWWHVSSKTAVSGNSSNRWKRWNGWNLISP